MTDEISQISPNYYGCSICEHGDFSQEKILEHIYSIHSDEIHNTYNTSENSPLIRLFFYCSKCKYRCVKKSDYVKHCATKKHNKDNDTYEHHEYVCHCGKTYKHRQSLYSHKSSCNINCEPSTDTIDNETLKHTITNNYQRDDVTGEPLNQTELIIELLKQNQEFKDLIIEERREFQQIITEQNKQMNTQSEKMMELAGNMGNNNTTNSNNNNKFNMNVFLNEKCKDAMNIMDFVNSMDLQLSDLEELGELGYVEGISRQMIRKLSEMDVYKRPIHCSDLKRETIYVRDNGVWEKETITHDKLRKAIKYVTAKNGYLLEPWRDANPQCMNTQHPLNDVYVRIMSQAMGGKGEFFDNENKIIKKVSKVITIDKKDF